MSEKLFRFRHFSLYQSQNVFKIGTDGVLLGAWAEVDNSLSALDIGTGTGLLPLILLQRNSKLQITAIDVNPEAAALAKKNIAMNTKEDYVEVHHSTFQDHASDVNQQYDLIITNPPYFSSSLKSGNAMKDLARHNDHLNWEALATGVLQLLNDNGRFCIILPVLEGTKFKDICENDQLYCTSIMNIFPTETKPVKRLLMQFEKKEKPCSVSSLVIEDNGRHGYSEDYKKLTREFYPNI